MRKVFIDTNVILEGIMRRSLALESEKLMAAVAANKFLGYISVGSFYTITFYAERRLKEIYTDKAERMEHLRVVLSNLLALVTVIGQGNKDLLSGIMNPAFDDLEDSYQYQACIEAGCDVLVTINTKDFPKEGSVTVNHLADFVSHL